MSVDAQTIQTYNASAAEFMQHFQKYRDGVAREEIDRAFAAAPTRKPKVVEVGCGAGKEAAAILERAGWYEGFDPSARLLEIAKTNIPSASFVQADALS